MLLACNANSALERKFRGCGYSFRHYGGAKFDFLRWQAGRIEVEDVIIPAHIATGGRGIELDVEKFFLIAWQVA
jgi:hypothetical protein